MTAIKFCGLMRAEDARRASDLGASYAGVIFAGGPRTLTPAAARDVLAATTARRVGVFGAATVGSIASVAREVGLDVIQLHSDPTPHTVREVRAATGLDVWAVIRCAGTLPPNAVELFEDADAVVLDARHPSGRGGMGIALPWDALRDEVRQARGGRRLVLAGGLTPENVSMAIAALAPDIVDVSSGIESAPGAKDEARMRAFVDAVRAAATTSGVSA